MPKTSDVLQFWENNKAAFPRLCATTRKIFSVPATKAGAERLFSLSGFVLRSRRLRITDRNFHDLVFARFNLNLPARKRKVVVIKS